MRTLNLATRPTRNETLPNVFFYVAVAVLLAMSVKHALVVRSLLPDRTSARHVEAASLEQEANRLRAEAAALQRPAPEPAVVVRWARLKDLVDARTFSWTRLLARLEKVVPTGVRITSITPSVRKGQIHLELTVEAQGTEAGHELLRRLQQRSDLQDVFPVSAFEKGTGGIEEDRFTMQYDPTAGRDDSAAAPSAADDPAESVPAEGGSRDPR